MQVFLTQAKHNENFYVCICQNYADNFFDWKITVAFYIAVHYLKALAKKKNVDLSPSHYDVEKQVNPDKRNELNLTRNAWDWYFNLYLESRTARYQGFTSDHAAYMAIKKVDYDKCDRYLTKLRNYMKGKGVQIAE